MNRHDDLRLLLTAFAPQEKRALLQQEAPNSMLPLARHIKLLCNEPHLDAAGAARRLRLSVNQYKTACAKTYAAVLRFLLQAQTAAHIEHQVQQLHAIACAQTEKGLFAEAQKTIAKGIQLAQQYELHASEITLQYSLQQVLFYLPAQVEKGPPQPSLQRITALVQQQTQTACLRLVYQQLLLLRYKYALCILPAEQQQLEMLAQQLQTVAPGEPDSVIARVYFFHAQLLVCFMLGRTGHILAYNESLLRCWKQHSHFVPLHPELFIRSASLQAYTHFLAKEVDRAAQFLEQYRQLAGSFLTHAGHQHWFAVTRFHTTLKLLHKTYQYEELACFFSAQWPQMYRVLPALPRPEKMDILLSACITHFALQQWAGAEALILEIKEENRQLKRSDTLYFTFIFHCLILFEQREWSRLHSLINSGYHFLYRNKTLRPFERDMLLFIKKLPLITISTNGNRNLKLFLQKLDSYKQHPVHRLHFAYFDFYTWVESKTEGISYMDLMRRKATQGDLVEA